MIESIHNKNEYPPMHTAEHILNRTMVLMFGCARSHNAHVERKKSKCDYYIDHEPSIDEINEIVTRVNDVIKLDLPVTDKMVPLEEAKKLVDLSKMPEGDYDSLRLVFVGDYDACACAGAHVLNTAQIGEFTITSYDYNKENKVLRLRFKLKNTSFID